MAKVDFEVFLPLTKATETPEGDVILEGPLSSERRDLQKQRMLRSSLEKGLAHYANTGQIVDWNHYSKPQAGIPHSGEPKWIIGHGVKLFDGPSADGQMTKHLRTKLLAGTEVADQVIRMKKAAERAGVPLKLYYSVGGSCAVNKYDDIVDSVVDHVAVTPTPANPDALIGFGALAKSLFGSTGHAGQVGIRAPGSLAHSFSKTLSAGSGAGLGSTGGRALIGEDLEGAQRRTNRKRRSKMDKLKLAAAEGIIEDPDLRKAMDDLAKSDNPETKAQAGLFKGMFAAFGNFIGMLKSQSDKDDDDDDEGGDDADGDGSSCEDDDQGGMPMGKGWQFGGGYGGGGGIGGQDDGVTPVSVDQFGNELVKAMVAEFRTLINKELQPLRKRMDTLSEQQVTLAKALGPESEQQTMLKGIDQQLAEIGKNPFMRPMMKTGAGASQTPGEQQIDPQTFQKDRAHTIKLLEKGVKLGAVDNLEATKYTLYRDHELTEEVRDILAGLDGSRK